MDKKFCKINEFLDSLESESIISDDLSVLLVGGKGSVRSTTDFGDCGGGFDPAPNTLCHLNTIAGCTNFSSGCVNTAHACTDAPYGGCSD